MSVQGGGGGKGCPYLKKASQGLPEREKSRKFGARCIDTEITKKKKTKGLKNLGRKHQRDANRCKRAGGEKTTKKKGSRGEDPSLSCG